MFVFDQMPELRFFRVARFSPHACSEQLRQVQNFGVSFIDCVNLLLRKHTPSLLDVPSGYVTEHADPHTSKRFIRQLCCDVLSSSVLTDLLCSRLVNLISLK
jgi:hypothetical protein